MTVGTLRDELMRLLSDDTIYDDIRLSDRLKAVETADLYFELTESGGNSMFDIEVREFISETIRHDTNLLQDIRSRISEKSLIGIDLIELIRGFSEGGPADVPPSYPGPDGADALVSRLFDCYGFLDGSNPSNPEMIHLEFTPVRAFLEFLETYQWHADDVFADIGCGPGALTLLTCLASNVHSIGVDIEGSYIRHAIKTARHLNVHCADFISADARDIELQHISVFYLFSPFVGSVLSDMVAKLEIYARAGPITVCTFGPITREIEAVEWLTREGECVPDQFTIAQYRSNY